MNNIEQKQDDHLRNSINTLNNMTDVLSSEDDPLEKTMDIKSIDIKKRMIEDLKIENTTSSKEKGKTLTKKNSNIKLSEDVNEIASSFFSCFVLSLITASIGTGWLIYIINHI